MCNIVSAFSVINFAVIVLLIKTITLVFQQNSPTVDHDLVIGVLSARSNFKLRQAVRETWLQHVKLLENAVGSGIGSIKLWFIIGKEDCHISPEDRYSSLSCIPWRFNVPDNTDKQISLFSSRLKETNCEQEITPFIHQGFSFRVHHPIITHKLGIIASLVPYGSNVTIALLNGATKEIVISTVIEHDSNHTTHYLMNSVETYLLPKGFEGIVLVSGHLYNSACLNWQWDTGGGVISFSKIYPTSHDSDAINFDEGMLAAPVFNYFIKDVDQLWQHALQFAVRDSEWKANLFKVEKKLREEITKFRDIFVADIVDIYRNIPDKLVKFIEWLSARHRFSYLLKTDDDTCVNVRGLMNVIHSIAVNPSEKIWMGRPRKNWAVNHFGKWADHDYSAPVYPLFMCGSGYILTRSLTDWLAQNSKILHYYQGEDVSMGIWLASILPNITELNDISCDDQCSPHTLIRAQLSPSTIYKAWESYKMCGSICHCK